jgi:hypothetical protein
MAGAQQTSLRRDIAREEVVARYTSHLEEAALGWNSAAPHDHTVLWQKILNIFAQLYSTKN